MMKKTLLLLTLIVTTIPLASCGNKTFTVTFDSKGGSQINPQNVSDGELLKKPADPIKTDYVFDKWLLNDKEYDFSLPVKSNFTLTASYKDEYFPEDENSHIPENIHDYDNLSSYTFKLVNHPDFDTEFTSIDFTLNEPFTDLINNDATVFNKKLLQFSEISSSEINKEAVAKFKNPKTGEYESDGTLMSAFKYLGFKDVRYYNDANDLYDIDANDKCPFGLANKEITLGGNKYQIFGFNFRGTVTNWQWSSNFDLGIDGPTYTSNREEEHPEWENKDNHKGFDIAATRCKAIIDKYVNKFKNNDCSLIYTFFGHSRGAAVANIVAQRYTDLGIKTTAYVSAGPNSSSNQESVEGYDNIFNLVNNHDIVPSLFSNQCQFYRNGITKTFSITENADDFNNTFVGYDYVDTDLTTYIDIINEYMVNRDHLYTLNSYELKFDDLKEAKLQIKRYNNYFAQSNPVRKRLIVDEEPEQVSDDQYTVGYQSSDALLFDLLIDIFNNINNEKASILEIVTNYFPYLPRLKEIVETKILDIILGLNIPAFQLGHQLANYIYASFKLEL